jgi:hypothetical protein
MNREKTKQTMEALKKELGGKVPMSELEAIVYQEHVLDLRSRHRAERHARLAAMTPPERLATQFRDDVIYVMSPRTDIICGSDGKPTFETLKDWHMLNMSGLSEANAVEICASTACKLLQEGWLTWNSKLYVYERTIKVEEPWE